MGRDSNRKKEYFFLLLCSLVSIAPFLSAPFLSAYITLPCTCELIMGGGVLLCLLLYSLSHLVSLRFALSICSWNQLTVNLFPGISTSPGDLPIDWPFNPVVKILPILTDMKQFQFGCFKVLARVIRNVKYTYPLCRAQTLPENRFAWWRWPLPSPPSF